MQPKSLARASAAAVGFFASWASAADPAISDPFTRSMARGPLYAALTAFVGGLLVCLTPCVYPMVAITVTVFGARQAPSRAEALGLSTAFVLGIVAMFTPLGVIAAGTGTLFGSVLSQPWVVVGVAIVLFALALSMFGAYELLLPSSLTTRLANLGGVGVVGAFLMGLVTGVIAAPCTGPVLAGVLIWIGETRNFLLGAGVMAAFAVGLGMPFWIVGTFAVRLPKAGAWMVSVKSYFGIGLACAALYVLGGAVPWWKVCVRSEPAFALGAGLTAVIGLVAVGWRRVDGWIGRAGKPVGIGLSILGLSALLGWGRLPPDGIRWEPFTRGALARARAEHKPILIDFTADWCAACQELVQHTFSAPLVIGEASRFASLRVDATRDEDAESRSAQRLFHVVGLPTVVFVDSDGAERARINEFVSPDAFAERLRATR